MHYDSLQSSPPPMSSSMTSLRINVVLKHDEAKKVSVIIRGSTKLQEVKRKIEHEFEELLNTRIIVGLIQDKDGFTISNNSYLGEHVVSGCTLYVIPEEIDLGQKMSLSSDLHDNFLTLRYVANSFCDKMSRIEVPKEMPLEDLLPEFLHLGFWYNNTQATVGVAKLLKLLFQEEALKEYFGKEVGGRQKILLLTLLEFWLKEVDVLREKEFFVLVLELLDKLSRVEGFAKICKNHSLTASLVKLSKEETVELIHQRQIQRVINNVMSGGRRETTGFDRSQGNRVITQLDYVPSFMDSTVREDGQSIEPILDMVQSHNLEMRNFGLKTLESNLSSFASQLLSLKDPMTKLHQLITLPISKANERVMNSFLDQVTKRVTKPQSVQMLHQHFLLNANRLFQESSPAYHQRLHSLAETVGSAAGYKGSIEEALVLINNPYKSLQEVALKIIEGSSEGNHQIFRRMLSKHMKDLILACLDPQATSKCVISILSTFNNTLMDDECRVEMLALKGIQVLTKMLQHPNVQVQRLSAKGLLNVSLSSRQNKIKVLGAMAGFLELMYKNKLDKVVEGYLETLLKRK